MVLLYYLNPSAITLYHISDGSIYYSILLYRYQLYEASNLYTFNTEVVCLLTYSKHYFILYVLNDTYNLNVSMTFEGHDYITHQVRLLTCVYIS